MNQKRFHFYCCRFYENGQLVEGPRLLAVKEVLAVVMSRDFLKKELLVLNDTERNITYPHLHIDTGIDDSYLLLLINRKVVTKSINMFESVSVLVYPYLYMGIITRTQAPIVMIEDYPGSPQAPADVTKVLTSTFSERLASFGYTLMFVSYQPNEIEMEFSVKFGVDAGAIITSVSSESSLTFRLTEWRSTGSHSPRFWLPAFIKVASSIITLSGS